MISHLQPEYDKLAGRALDLFGLRVCYATKYEGIEEILSVLACSTTNSLHNQQFLIFGKSMYANETQHNEATLLSLDKGKWLPRRAALPILNHILTW
jgi:hypothetical protein